MLRFMSTKRFLTVGQKDNLLKALKENDCSNFIQRILMLLLRNEGKTYQEIAEFLGCSYRTVAYWCVHGDPEDIESLRDKRTKGNYRKVTEDYMVLLMETIARDPRELGYSFPRWSGDRLAEHLTQLTGITLSGSQIRNILRKEKINLSVGKKNLGRSSRNCACA
jgi:transposase